jgi:hypothetical protein
VDRMTRVMFDSNIWDAILDYGDADKIADLIKNGRLLVATTHIQKDQLGKTPDKIRRTALLDIYRRLNEQTIKTSAALWDASTWDQSSWTGPNEESSLSAIQRNKTIASDDEVIGLTAKDYCDIFVTQDRKFSARLTEAAPNLRVLDYSAFRKEFLP